MLLVSGATRTMERIRDPRLGRLVTPRSRNIPDALPWALDNAAFSGFVEDAFVDALERYRGMPHCLWVACPDVVADSVATLALFAAWHERVRKLGYRVALVAQNGLAVQDTPWDSIDCLFIGGDTRWKLSWEAHVLCREAKTRGKSVHIGRVNSKRRFLAARQMGADTIDGSGFSRFPDTRIPKALRWMDEHEPQEGIFK